MTPRFPAQALIRIVEQALIYQCACPAQVCKALAQIRDLDGYQRSCIEKGDNNDAVHRRISESCERVNAELERCLEDVLKLEGWNLETLEMPESLQKKMRPNLG